MCPPVARPAPRPERPSGRTGARAVRDPGPRIVILASTARRRPCAADAAATPGLVPRLGVTPGAICAAARPVRAGRRAPLAGHPDSLDVRRRFVAANDPSRYFREASTIPAQPVTSYGRPGATEQN